MKGLMISGLQRVLLATAVGALLASGLVQGAAAQWRPDRPVRLVLPFAPGGGADAVARVITPKLQESLGQPWVVDNRGGAGGNIAAETVARASPDGHTVFLGFSTVLTVNPLLYKLPFDVMRDFSPVAMITSGQYMMVLHPSVKAGSIKEFIDVAKGRSSPLNYGSAGMGTPLNLAAELFKVRTGIELTHVPYKGGGPAVAALVGGEVQVMFASLPAALPHVKAARLRALAVTGPKRAAIAPELPTVAESGFPGYEVTSWYGMLLPAKTPAVINRTVLDQLVRIMQLADIREHMTRQGLEITVMPPAEFRAQIQKETAVWAGVIKAAGITAQ